MSAIAAAKTLKDLEPQQRRQWEDEGYLLIPGALSTDEVGALLDAADRAVARSEDRCGQGAAGGAPQVFKVVRAVEQEAALDLLIDHPATLPVLVALMGPSLQVLGTEIFVRLPAPGPERLLEWHKDGGPSLSRLLCQPEGPVLQLKIQYFLTDLTSPDSGNFQLVPGSHRRPFPADGKVPAEDLARAVQVLARPGDALIFPWALWHAVAPNHSGRVRKSVTLRWGQLFCRPYDFERLPAALLARWTPRQRRLFGELNAGQQPHDYYYSDEADQIRLLTV
ncbi:MAG TPA: phytanoyl-CoA dioxygenase family protein [Thermoanaerobaculia bacterium]|nr:phytanoyl-CoA dioxygenase family protein [Thermoanaerobaculia bacterium]